MGWREEEIAKTKPLFMTIYVTVVIGIVFSAFYVFSAIYSSGTASSAPSTSSWWFPTAASHVDSPPLDQTPNSTQPTAVSVVLVPAPQPQSKLMKPIWEVPPGSKMPPLKTFRLTKELVQQRVKDNIVVVTFGNYAFMDFILTWVKHLTDLGLDNVLVGAMDTKLLEALYWKGVPVFDMGSHMSTVDVGWGSPTFHKMGREKVILIDSILPFGYELLMCDTDMVWLKNPLPYLARFPEADVLTSTDQVIPTVVDDRLDIWQQVGAAYNIGIFHWRPTDPAKKLAKEWKDMLLADDKIWDQNGFNELVHRQLGPSVDDDSGLVYAYDGNLKVGLLPASIFCSGHTYFVQAMHQQLRLEPYAVHTTFQYAGTEGKRHRLREGMVFYDPPEYYDSPGGFLSFKPSIPKSLLLDGKHNIESHFSLINYQTKQIRTALAIASLLNRTLVQPRPIPEGVLPFALKEDKVFIPIQFQEVIYDLKPTVRSVCKSFGHIEAKCPTTNPSTSLRRPKPPVRSPSRQWRPVAKPKGPGFGLSKVMPPLWCRLDRLWFPHPGVLAGTITRQPFLCPLDHVFEVNVMLKEMDEEEFGPGINLREYSFFDNPLMPKQVKESWLDVQLCQEGSQNCNVSNSTSPLGVLKFPKRSNEETLFDKMSQREQSLENTRFCGVLDLVRFSAVTPDILTGKIVHCLVMKFFTKDVVIWNAMMTACIENGCFEAAVGFCVEMMEKRNGFDSGTLVIAISALSHLKRLQQGQTLHGLSVKAGMLSDSFLCNSLVGMYAKCSDLSSSECMFEGMDFRDIVSWNSMISGYLYNNNPEKSLQYFKKMASCGKQADDVSLSCAMAASTCLGEFGVGQVIHGWGIKLGYKESYHISVGNSIISLYSESRETEAAETVFRRMVHKDVISWNSMIDGFASNGMFLETFDLLHEMQLIGSVQPDAVTIVTVVPVCAELLLLREGRSVHGFAVRRGMVSDLSVLNSLMDLYLKCNNVKAAELLFNPMPYRDLISWHTVISGYSQNGYSREAQTLFKELLRQCSQCSVSTLLAVLSSCSSTESLEFGKSIHCWQLKLGFSNNHLAINSLMFMYINCGDLKASLSLLSRISAMADTACWNTVIAGCTQNGHFQTALETFNLMRESHVSHDSITLVNVISACGNLELELEGKLLHGLAFKTLEGTDTRVQNALITMYGRLGEIESAKLVFTFGCNRNLCSWNCMISALSQNKDGKRALELFRSLKFEPNEITISSVLSACTQLGLLRHGKQIHAYVFRFDFHTNHFISAAFVDMYSNCGRLDVALKIFQNLPEKSVAAWNSMISAFGFHNKGQKAIEVFHEMVKSGTNPTKTTFINLLSACSHLGLVEEGRWYYDHMMDEFGVEPSTEHLVCMVNMLGRSGRLDEAYDFIKRMRKQPDPGVWGGTIKCVQLPRRSCDGWSDAAELRRIIQDKGLKKPAGYSLIDVGFG
ncbi:xyloglucanase 113 [Actinidia rufa]|uniref:Xyloglucanase 113 n=1 Tax=Actinidia rufa TaxID=165716 RepID=A0A7J0GZZ0_9ERIC|nr:xyloglucanase 113 [Actinidia rufa]